jgi:SAM-dependent methyltransferase
MPICPICPCMESTEFYQKNGQQLLICRNCRHIWWQNLPPYEEISRYYLERYTKCHGQETIQNGHRNYYRSHLAELLSMVQKRAEETCILDYGCSIPALLHEAVKLSFRSAIGVDYSPESKDAGRKWGVRVLLPSELAGVPDAFFDIARFSHTIEHCIDPLAVLRSMLPKMRPGGLIYITQPNFPVFHFALSDQDLKDTLYPEHLHFFSPLSLMELTRILNLKIVKLFSHQNEAEVVRKYGNSLDIEYARERLINYASHGDAAFPSHANYPYYAGENSVLHALVPGA